MKKTICMSLCAIGLLAQDIVLNGGWQLLGAKGNIDNMSYFENSAIDVVWQYKNDGWYPYYTSGDKKIISNISAGEGFWVKSNKSGNIVSIPNKDTTIAKLSLKSGWQLLGATSDIESTKFANPNIHSIWSYSSSGWKSFNSNTPSKFNIQAGEGFWIYVYNPVEIDLRTTTSNATGYTSDNGILTSITNPTLQNGDNKKLLAIYIVGSNLESGDNAGTTDINELISGYNKLSKDEQSKLDIIVAFGGADKDGWRGIKIANISQLIEDSKDSEYGNLSQYLYSAEQAHMGDSSSFELFLNYLKSGYKNHYVKFLDMWDHGGSYNGFGNDENFENDPLTLQEQQTTLKKVGLNFDIIGFDACLNGSFEVANVVKDNATYLIGSEELEPGHGWPYEQLITNFVKKDVVEFGKSLIDDYIKSENHPYQSDGKTLSFVDLRAFDNLRTSVDSIASLLNESLDNSLIKESLIYASTNTQEYGKESKSDSRVSIDLLRFAKLIEYKTTDSTIKTKAQTLITNLSSYIIYAKEDGTRPNSNGVSIAPIEGGNGFEESSTPSNYWFNLTQNFNNMKVSDNTPPIIEEEYLTSISNSEFDDGKYKEFEQELQDEINKLILTDWKTLYGDELKKVIEEYRYKKLDEFYNSLFI